MYVSLQLIDLLLVEKPRGLLHQHSRKSPCRRGSAVQHSEYGPNLHEECFSIQENHRQDWGEGGMGLKFCFLFQRRNVAQSINPSTYVLQVITTQPPGEKNTFTVSLAARADGTKLPAVIIFKASNVKIGVLSPGIMKKLDIADNVMVWSSRSGWWNERLDHMWIDHTFGNSEAEGNTVLIRDQFPVHKKDSSAEKLEELGVDQVQSINQSINQSMDQVINQAINQSISRSPEQQRCLCTDLYSGRKNGKTPADGCWSESPL